MVEECFCSWLNSENKHTSQSPSSLSISFSVLKSMKSLESNTVLLIKEFEIVSKNKMQEIVKPSVIFILFSILEISI
jgi:hypothetical protein